MILIQWCRRWGVVGVAAALMFNMCAASSIEIAQDASQRPRRVSVSDDGLVALRMGNDNYGKLDVFLNLSGPESSVAWSTLKKAVQDYRDRVEFVFHVNLLPSDNPVAHTVSKAAYLISDRGFEEEAEAFLDQIFGNQGLFREGGSEDEIIENWVTASGGTFDVFNFASTAEDPTSDEKAARSLSTIAPPLIGMRPTAVYLDGILMTYLDESTDAGASTSFGRYLNGFIGWKANSLLLEKQNEKLLGERGPA